MQNYFWPNMADEPRKRARLSFDQKLWIIKHKRENRRITLAEVALDFSEKFKRPISHQAISYVIKNRNDIYQNINADPEKNLKKTKYVKKDAMAKFEADWLSMVEEIDKTMDLSHELVKFCAQSIQNRPEYADNAEIQKLKFSGNMITNFTKSHNLRKIYLKM